MLQNEKNTKSLIYNWNGKKDQLMKILTECRVSMPFRSKLSHYSMEYDSIFNVVYLHRKLLLVLGRSSGSTSCALSAGPPHQTYGRVGACSETGSPQCLSSSLGFAECPEGGCTVYKLFFTCFWELRCL